MTAKDFSYFYIYNSGLPDVIIFRDKQDYDTFLMFIKDYLTPPQDPNEVKEEFDINGKKFFGVPHQPKNFFGQIDLVSYNLRPNSFHLVLNEKAKGAIESFLRSLSTRYVIYYNKKYKRKGPLLQRPYKSIQINVQEAATSYVYDLEYINMDRAAGIKPNTTISFEPKIEAEEKESLPRGQPNENLFSTSKNVRNGRFSAIFGGIVATVIYIVLFGVGLKNVRTSSAISPPKTETESTQEIIDVIKQPDQGFIETPVPIPIVDTKKELVVTAGSADLNINVHQLADPDSKTIFKAKKGELYEYSYVEGDWYEILLPDGTSGFIMSEFIKEVNQNER